MNKLQSKIFYDIEFRIAKIFAKALMVVLTTLGTNIIKLFYLQLTNFLKKARVFVPGKPLKPNLMSTVESRTYPSEASFRCSTLR
jgi:hypothetical protein